MLIQCNTVSGMCQFNLPELGVLLIALKWIRAHNDHARGCSVFVGFLGCFCWDVVFLGFWGVFVGDLTYAWCWKIWSHCHEFKMVSKNCMEIVHTRSWSAAEDANLGRSLSWRLSIHSNAFCWAIHLYMIKWYKRCISRTPRVEYIQRSTVTCLEETCRWQ